MSHPVERRFRLSEDLGSPAEARRLVRAVLHENGLDHLAADTLLLTSELCENAVLHAGTGFELAVTIDDGVTVAVTDHGSTAMELRRAVPPEPGDRRASHGRGLQLVGALATAWGSRHDERGHQVWFTIRTGDGTRDRVGLPAKPTAPPPFPAWPNPATSRWLLHLPARTTSVAPLPALVAELVRRLCDVLGAEGACVRLNRGDGEQELVRHGLTEGAATFVVTLPLTPPYTGRLHVHAAANAPDAPEIAELSAHRIALAVELDRLHTSNSEWSMWLTYLAEATQMLNNSLDVELTSAIVPQVVVPRLGRWCAVHLLDERGRLRLAALNHIDETELPKLTAALTASSIEDVPEPLHRLLDGRTGTTVLGPPLAGVAVPLLIAGVSIGAVSVGRSDGREHTVDEIMMISELAQRAAQAIHNAQRDAAHVATSQALQHVLLPRALPTAEAVRFAAAYLPASTGADVGGDFYDVLSLPDGRWLVTVGDVCGKGARAAARTSLVRDVLRVLVRDGQPLPRAFELLNEMMMEANDPSQFATVALALIGRPAAGPAALAVDLVLSGHEQPALLRADGTVSLVGRHGSAVGLVQNYAVHQTRHHLYPGDTLVFYTDGVTEHHHQGVYFGHQRLMDALVRQAGQPADRVVNALRRAVHDFASHTHRDDIAIVAVEAMADLPSTTPSPPAAAAGLLHDRGKFFGG